MAGYPVPVDPPGADPKAVLQRAALALDAGRVIIPYGGNAGDCGIYHGWLRFGLRERHRHAYQRSRWKPAAGEHGGAIWGAGDGPSLDRAGSPVRRDRQRIRYHLDASTCRSRCSNSVPTCSSPPIGPPATGRRSISSDLDLGSSEPLPLPGGRLLFVAGKDGVGRLLSETALGTTGQVFSAPACTSRWRRRRVALPGRGDLRALLGRPDGAGALHLAEPELQPPAILGQCRSGAAGPPIFAGGLVWSTGWRGTKILYGLDPATGAIRFRDQLSTFNHFATPSAGGGRLFVAVGVDGDRADDRELPAACRHPAALIGAPALTPAGASAPPPLGLALLEERPHTLLDVLGGEGDRQLGAQEVDARRRRPCPAGGTSRPCPASSAPGICGPASRPTPRTAASNSPARTTRLTIPIRSASWADICSPSSISSVVFLRRTLR